MHPDQTLSVKQHISSICRTTFLALRRISSICPFLSKTSTEKLVASMITSRLDWSNATFAGEADEQTACIQKIQNNAAQLVLKKSMHDHVTLLLKEISHFEQACNARFPSLRRHSSAIPVFFSLHKSTIALPSFFDRTTAQNSEGEFKNVWWTSFLLHCSDCLELAAGQPESFSLLPNFQG